MPMRFVPAGRRHLVAPVHAAAAAAVLLLLVAMDAGHGEQGSAQASVWNPLPNGGFENGQVLAMATVGDDLYVGGYFSRTADGALSNLGNVARYDTQAGTWHALPNAGLSSIVYAMAVVGTDLYVAGGFSHTGDGRISELGLIARFDTVGRTWHALPAVGLNYTTNRQPYVYALAVDGSDLFVGGAFSQTGDGSLTDLGGIARYNATTHTWHSLSAMGLRGSVRALAISHGVVFAGGEFQETGDGSVSELGNIARYDGSWHALANGGLSGTTTGVVRALAFDGNDLFVGGGFTQTADGVVTNLNRIAHYDATSGVWRALPRSGLNDQVFALAVAHGALYVGGYLTESGDGTLTDLGRIAVYRPDDNLWNAMPNAGLAVGGAGHCRIETILPFGHDLFVGGGFGATGDWSVTGLGGITRFGTPPPDTSSTVYLPAAARE